MRIIEKIKKLFQKERVEKDEYGRTLLHYCEDEKEAKMLLKKGIDVNTSDLAGQTPLHTCSRIEVAKILLKNGANVNIRDSQGNTALHYCNSFKLTEFLIEAGANVNATNNQGLNPEEFRLFLEKEREEERAWEVKKAEEVNRMEEMFERNRLEFGIALAEEEGIAREEKKAQNCSFGY